MTKHFFAGLGLAFFQAFLSSPGVSQAALVEFSRGHGDLGVGYEGGELDPHWHFGANAVLDGSVAGAESEYGPGEAFARVPDPAIGRPTGSQFDFLGIAAGENLWFLPASEDVNKPFLGFGTEELVAADWSTPIRWTLTAASMPTAGQFGIWGQDASLNFVAPVATADGIDASDFLEINPESHLHFNLGFTELGVYDLTFDISGTHAVDGFKSSTATFKFVVGSATAVPEPGTFAILGLGAIGMAGARYRRRTVKQA